MHTTFGYSIKMTAEKSDPFDFAISRRIDKLDGDIILGRDLREVCCKGVVLAPRFASVDNHVVDVNSDLACVALGNQVSIF